MRDIAIIGSGELGGALAHVLARKNAARSIRLIEDAGRIAEGKALDISQAAPIEGFATELSGSADVTTAAGASAIVIADRVRDGEWQGDEGLLLIRRLVQIASRSVIVCAGAAHRELIDSAVGELRVPRTRIVGSAPEALVAGARALVGLNCDVSPRDVSLSVVGVPPDRIVLSWEDATVGGFSARRLLDEPSRRRISAQMAGLWPPGPYALATAAAHVIDVIFGRSRRLACCFVAPDHSAGRRARTAALPVRLNEEGVEEVVMPLLSSAEQVRLDNAMML